MIPIERASKLYEILKKDNESAWDTDIWCEEAEVGFESQGGKIIFDFKNIAFYDTICLEDFGEDLEDIPDMVDDYTIKLIYEKIRGLEYVTTVRQFETLSDMYKWISDTFMYFDEGLEGVKECFE